MVHLKAPYTQFNIRITDGTNTKNAGQYYREAGLPTIEVMVRPNYTSNQIIAIVCHECMHHFLDVKKIKGKTGAANEKLTDYTAIYTGFGKILQDGYSPVTTFANGQNTETKLGYITVNDILVARDCLPEFK